MIAGHRRRPRGFRAVLLVVGLAFTGVVPSVATAGAACAADARAGLVVDTGARVLRLCVGLPDGPVSGIELIELAADQHGLDYRLGFGGKAVCRLDGVGTDSGDCFDQFPSFWGYWRASASGSWQWSSTGAGDTVVEPGDLEGWVWGTGQDAATHRRPPSTNLTQLCGSPNPDPDPDPDGNGGGGGGGRGGGGDGPAPGPGDGAGGGQHPTPQGVAGPPGSGEAGSKSGSSSGGGRSGANEKGSTDAGLTNDEDPGGLQAAGSPSPTSGPAPIAGATELAASRAPAPAGVPFGVVLALVAALLLGLGGAYLVRRHPPRGD